MERLSFKEIRFVIDTLKGRKEALRARLERNDIDEDAAGDAGEDLMLCDSLINFFEKQKDEEFARSRSEVAGSFDLESIRNRLREE